MKGFALALACALGCFGVLACGGPDGPRPKKASWVSVSEELPGALFSVSGTAPDDVWIVGADRGDGDGPTLLHFDGEQWTAHASGFDSGNLMWVHVFEDGPVFASGSEGRVLRYEDDEFVAEETPEARDVWGVWGASPGDLWAVGGDPELGTGFIWRNEGDGFVAVELGDDLPSPSAWYKVWGTAEDDVWFCGTTGALLHYDGSGFDAVDSATERVLLTIHGRPDGSRITAVGGTFTATFVASDDGGAFEDVTPEGPPRQTFGVFHGDDGAYSVGMQGTVLRQSDGAWQLEDTGLDSDADFHSVWIDPSGAVWAVGGQILSPPFTDGALMYKGQSEPAGIEF